MSPHDQLRTEGQRLNAEIKSRKTRLDEINAALLESGAGKFEECTIVGESTQVIVPDGADDTRVQELAGEHYGKLFEKTTGWKCVKGFADVVSALFPVRTAEAILKRCTKAKAGFVKWN
jgi:hypothetical protein